MKARRVSAYLTLDIKDTIPTMDLSVLVFNSYKDAACGHALSLRDIVNQKCPICGTTVGFVMEEVPSTPSLGNHRFVYFKFGKISYRLNIVNRHETSWWSTLFGTGNSNAFTRTAQGRIQTVLGLSDEMKILCKGKVLYPKPDQDEETVSASLVDLSLTNWKNKAPPSLTVMGTRETVRQKWLEREKSYLQQRSSGGNAVWLVLDATVHFVQHIVAETFRFGVSWAMEGYRLLSRVFIGGPRQHVQ